MMLRSLRLTVTAPGLGLLALLLVGCHAADEPDREADDPAERGALAAPATTEATVPPPAWAYVSTAVPDETRPQKAATLRNLRPDDEDPGSFAVVPTVQLVLRDDPRWGQSVYLVIEEGHFDCGQPCAFQLRFDDGAMRTWAGKASSTGTRPALFIEDDRAFIAALDGARRLEIAPANGRSSALLFEVHGFSAARYAAGR